MAREMKPLKTNIVSFSMENVALFSSYERGNS